MAKKPMIILCKMNGRETELPCSASGCPLFGDCLARYEKYAHIKQTNADRIRAMSDEELAEWALHFVIDCTEKTFGEDCVFEDGAEAVMLQWLKQPAEGE